MKTSVKIAVVFHEHESYDLWEHFIVGPWSSHRVALDCAIALSRRVCGNQLNYTNLGYSRGPLLYAMLSVDTDLELPFEPHANIKEEVGFMTKLRSLSESEFERLKNYEEIPVTLRFNYIMVTENENR